MKRKKRRWPVVLVLAALLLGAGIFGFPALERALDPYDGRILSGVSVAGIPLDGMTRSDAVRVLDDTLGVTRREILLTLPGETVGLTPAQTGIALDTRALVNAAYSIGRSDEASDAGLSLAPYLTVEEDSLRAALEAAAQQLAEGAAPTAWTLEGTLPDLTEDVFQPDDPLPTLVVRLGVPAYRLDVEAAYRAIRTGLEEGQFEIDLTGAAVPLQSQAPDVDAIWEDVALEPVDAKMDLTAGKPIPGSYGLSFDKAALETRLEEAAPGEEIRVELEAASPQVAGREVYFQDELGFCQTPHGDNEKRNTNLRLACQALNGVVLEPGETLSYNETLGQRTQEGGYQPAPAYSGTDLVDSVGGGICQVSSTLYLCSLFAEMTTVERVNHGFPASYMPVGLDATVSWPEPDLKIRNDTDYPVKIVAEEQEGFVRVWLMGTETRDYDVRMAFSSSSDGYARSFVCKYDRQTHELLSKEALHISSYMGAELSAVGEIGSGEIYLYGNVREQPPCSPTPETLEASKNYRPPNTAARQG